MLEYKNLKVIKFLQSGFLIEYQDGENMKNLYIDPYKLPEDQPKADIIFISHEHYDHLDVVSISKVVDSRSKIVGNRLVKESLADLDILNFIEAAAGAEEKFGSLCVKFIPAYNINKFNEDNEPYHPKENGGLGFYMTFKKLSDDKDIHVYHTGDTDFIEEFREHLAIDLFMVPISGTYVMSVKEAADAANHFMPNLAIPMHFDAGIVGKQDDGEKFTDLAECQVAIIEPLK